jgi:hypothetical protein
MWRSGCATPVKRAQIKVFPFSQDVRAQPKIVRSSLPATWCALSTIITNTKLGLHRRQPSWTSSVFSRSRHTESTGTAFSHRKLVQEGAHAPSKIQSRSLVVAHHSDEAYIQRKNKGPTDSGVPVLPGIASRKTTVSQQSRHAGWSSFVPFHERPAQEDIHAQLNIQSSSGFDGQTIDEAYDRRTNKIPTNLKYPQIRVNISDHPKTVVNQALLGRSKPSATFPESNLPGVFRCNVSVEIVQGEKILGNGEGFSKVSLYVSTHPMNPILLIVHVESRREGRISSSCYSATQERITDRGLWCIWHSQKGWSSKI